VKIKFRYLYDQLQEVIIKRLQEETEVKFRIRADRTIEFAKKWYPDVQEKANEIRFDMFVKPLIRTWNESIHISQITHKLADKNIPFVIENHNGTDWIIYEEHDVDAITDIERDLGLGLVDLLNKKY
jgi:hypothetical protein